jgi:EmrB/QacA subfamily drug resistance transporter
MTLTESVTDSASETRTATAARPQRRSSEPRPTPRPDFSVEGHPRRWLVLPVILTAMFMAMFDYFVVNVAAPSLQHDLGASEAGVELIVGGYGFAYASGLITGGRLGDILGHRRLFLIGMLAFTVASLLCGLAGSTTVLVVARILQGASAAVMVPQMLALINVLFPIHERAKAMAAFGATIGLGSVAGQVLGGVLLDLNLFGWGWRTIFFINVPIGLGAAFLAARWLPFTKSEQKQKLDPVGAIGISAALALFLIPLTVGRPEGGPLWTWLSMAASIPVLLGTVRYEGRLGGRGGSPVLDTVLLRQRTFASGMFVGAGYLTFFAGFMLCLTMVLQDGLGLTPLRAGLAFAPLGVSFALSSLNARRVAARIGNRVIAVGAVASFIGLALTLGALELRGDHITAMWLIPGMVVVGLGNGLALPTLVGAVLIDIHPKQAGLAAGAITTAQQFGNAIGVTVLGTLFFSVLGVGNVLHDYVSAMEVVAVTSMVVVVLVFAAAFQLPKVNAHR